MAGLFSLPLTSLASQPASQGNLSPSNPLLLELPLPPKSPPKAPSPLAPKTSPPLNPIAAP